VITEQDVAYFAKALSEVVGACHKFPGAAWEVGMTLVRNAAVTRTPPASPQNSRGVSSGTEPASLPS
jgi:hypothetical protein